MTPRILVVAGSDSGGGAGIQADIRTAMAFGAHASTALTALTVQDTRGVYAVHPVPPGFIAQQIEVALADPGADAVKTGMLGDAAAIRAVARALAPVRLPLVIDPVMVAKGGAPLLAAEAVDTLRSELLPLATLLTPNLPEAEVLTGTADADRAADVLLRAGVPAVLVKGGHGDGAEVADLLATPTGRRWFRHPRVVTRHTHGTGCTLATAIACGLASGRDLESAVERACRFVQAAIVGAPGLGAGHGPLGHDKAAGVLGTA